MIEFSGRMSRVFLKKIQLFFIFFEKTAKTPLPATMSTLYQHSAPPAHPPRAGNFFREARNFSRRRENFPRAAGNFPPRRHFFLPDDGFFPLGDNFFALRGGFMQMSNAEPLYNMQKKPQSPTFCTHQNRFFCKNNITLAFFCVLSHTNS